MGNGTSTPSRGSKNGCNERGSAATKVFALTTTRSWENCFSIAAYGSATRTPSAIGGSDPVMISRGHPGRIAVK
jgi:hypothetical protein